ncbi:MAG: folate-binding protein [Gallionella sp.]|nr:folate-binding protein [Gallionella sp.]
MNQDWQLFLQTQGAQIENDIVQHFGHAEAERIAARDGGVVCDLSQFGLLRVSGEEAQTFLQSLLSNDIGEVNGRRAQLSSLNDAKGRMIASLFIWRDADDYLVQLPRDLCEPVRKRLSMYVLRAKVKISDAGDEFVLLGLAGPEASAVAQTLLPDLPAESGSMHSNAGIRLIRLDASRYQICLSPVEAPALWTQLSGRLQPAGSPCWDGLGIRAGIPVITTATQLQFVAQMVNFEVIGGVNFKKGCYPGQEIVARMHYLGKPKRRMFLAHVDSDAAPQPGDSLYSAEMGEQAAGMIVNAAAAPEGGYDLLAVVHIASHDSQTIHLSAQDGPPLAFRDLPYPLP